MQHLEVAHLQGEGAVGDSVNDAAPAGSDLGLTLDSGTDATIEDADLTLVRRPSRGGNVIRLARRTLTTDQGQPVLVFAYNVAALSWLRFRSHPASKYPIPVYGS